ncbi:aminotransferase class V-fold PLP-dependent enzyme [Marinibactrum halimedae]|uniref:cysteine desulfurase n=1 Tax=Marinibactrum halimedae TaxID=1444977 RepID=A0AA37TDI1_9GAMM|nr:aminotransferase class V-fold PLP-dependent enzyme [Marinibactrum halimedae]MCD9461024.1 aminotransferase class V-fold PLP-dependent enzyme [Marinibactrum halimedae]GLS27790.1 hypothetical protein GCM10007877_35090 [Marinibactrum halimedae]
MTTAPFSTHAQLRAQFPLFQTPENQSLVYLDNAATTQKPQQVIEAISDFYRHSNSNAHRSSHRLGRVATHALEHSRNSMAVFLNAQQPEEIIFTRGATEALNLLAFSLCAELVPGDEVLLTQAEHHANLVPWQMAAKRNGLNLVFLPSNQGIPCFERLGEYLTDRTRIVSVTAASNALGFLSPLSLIEQTLVSSGRRDQLHWVLDGTQYTAHKSVDVQTFGCDFWVCAPHKFYGPTGVGVLWGRYRHLKAMHPWQGGGEMIREVTLQSSTYAEPPHRFEPGTASLADIAALAACVEFWQRLDRGWLWQHEQALFQRLYSGLSARPELNVLSPWQDNVGVISVHSDQIHLADLGHWLDECEVACRVGHHCTQPLMASLGVSHTLRFSIGAYNCDNDIDRALTAVDDFFASSDQRMASVALPLTTALMSTLSTQAEAPSSSEDTVCFEAPDLSLCSVEALKAERQWQRRYRLLLKWAARVPHQPEIRCDEYRVEGCESAAWLVAQLQDKRFYFYLDSDSNVVKGLGVLLLMLVQGQTAETIRLLPIKAIFSDLGLEKHLSPSRSNGFWALWNRIQLMVNDHP